MTFFKLLFPTCKRNIFYLQGRKLPKKTSKDDRKVLKELPENPVKSRAAKSEFEGIQQVMLICKYHSGERN